MAAWSPQGGMDSGELKIQVVNGSINNQSEVSIKMTGPTLIPFVVENKQGKNPTTITANIAASTDRVLVDYTLMPIQPLKKLVFNLNYMQIAPGGYTTRDVAQQMIVSGDQPNGGPSENYSFLVDSPRAATYSLEALWTAAVQTEVHVYVKPPLPTCANPNTDGAALHYFPAGTAGWRRENLPRYPDRLGYIMLPAGQSTITFTTIACGGGRGGGRLPSVAWVRLTEQ